MYYWRIACDGNYIWLLSPPHVHWYRPVLTCRSAGLHSLFHYHLISLFPNVTITKSFFCSLQKFSKSPRCGCEWFQCAEQVSKDPLLYCDINVTHNFFFESRPSPTKREIQNMSVITTHCSELNTNCHLRRTIVRCDIRDFFQSLLFFGRCHSNNVSQTLLPSLMPKTQIFQL